MASIIPGCCCGPCTSGPCFTTDHDWDVCQITMSGWSTPGAWGAGFTYDPNGVHELRLRQQDEQPSSIGEDPEEGPCLYGKVLTGDFGIITDGGDHAINRIYFSVTNGGVGNVWISIYAITLTAGLIEYSKAMFLNDGTGGLAEPIGCVDGTGWNNAFNQVVPISNVDGIFFDEI